MEVTFFESAVVAPDMRGHVLIAIFDGSLENEAEHSRLVTILMCRAATAEALRLELATALREKD